MSGARKSRFLDFLDLDVAATGPEKYLDLDLDVNPDIQIQIQKQYSLEFCTTYLDRPPSVVSMPCSLVFDSGL